MIYFLMKSPVYILILCIDEKSKGILRNVNTLKPRQNGHHFSDDTSKRIFLNENIRISIEISHKFAPKDRISNIP